MAESHRFTHAIVRLPPGNLGDGLTEDSLRHRDPDPVLAQAQHENYRQALRQAGLVPVVLPQDENFPDSHFVEDTAVVTDRVAVIAAPGHARRFGERQAIEDFFRGLRDIRHIQAPGTLDGGDVLRIGGRYFIGLSNRTNKEGARQLAAILEREGFDVEIVEVDSVLHLKTGITYIGGGAVLGLKRFVDNPAFSGYDRICVPEGEARAANCLAVNGRVIMPHKNPATAAVLSGAGFDVITVDIEEFAIMNGGVTCLSIPLNLPAGAFPEK